MRVSLRAPCPLLGLLLLGFTGLAGGACNRPAAEQPAANEAAPMRVGVENTVRVRKEIIRTGPRISGTLEPRKQARMRAEVAGPVTWVGVELGQQVKQGEVLVRIENSALENAYRSAQTALRSAQVALDNAELQSKRAETLYRSGAIASADMEAAQNARSAAEAQVAQARSQLTQARKQLRSAAVTSPMAGVISAKAVNQGDVVALGGELFTVIDPSSMHLHASVPSEDLPALKVGTQVDFEVRGFPGRHFRGHIERVAPAADPETRQITTEVHIPNPGGTLLAGLFADGRIGAQAKEALVVPTSAIDQSGNAPAVMRVQNGKVERIEVQLGLQDPQTERVEVLGAVREGDVLLTGAAKEIAPGTPVKLTAAEQAANF